MATAHLNRQTIAALPELSEGEAYVWESSLKGFGFLQRVSKASGELHKSFVIQYRFNGQQRKIKLGDANKLNVDPARKKAIKLFGQILDGVDPQAAKEAERAKAAALNHVSGHKEGLAGVYNLSTYAAERKTALAMWADHIESIVTGTERKVVAIRAA